MQPYSEPEPLTPLELAPLELSSDTPPWKPRSSYEVARHRTQAEDAVEAESPAPRFTDSFLQDRNIKWILGVGTAILLGSSLMLVSSQWAGYTAIFKELIVLAYTGLLFLVGRYSYERLALRRTGTVLLTLSVMLAPIACAALPLVWQNDTGKFPYLTLLVVAGALTARIGSRAFQHFLRAKQPSLTIPYVILALSAGIVPLSSATFAPFLRSPLMALALWFVFALGTIKVNRCVFHLFEKQQRPRIFGFFPMLLLAGQYFGLFIAFFAGQTPIEWIGFGAVLTAIPMLLAADVVADVFQSRTGNLVRPLPWSILLPFITGLLLCATGVALAASPMLERPTFALVPTALLASAVLCRVAQRTDKQAFVYAALVLIAVAYRFAPVYFAEAARALITSTAAAIQEKKLPIAYFGFTFVPLLALFTTVSLWAQRRGQALFAEPTRVFALLLSLLFLVLAPTHSKALFPASFTLLGVFAAQTALFRNRHYVLPALVAAVFAAAGLPQFIHGVLGIESLSFFASPTAWFTCEVVLAWLFLWPGQVIDRLLPGTPSSSLASEEQQSQAGAWRTGFLAAPCRYASLLTFVLSVGWLIEYWTESYPLPGLPTAGLLALLGLTQAFVFGKSEFARYYGCVALTFANLVAAIAFYEQLWFGYHYNDQYLPAIATGLLLVQWIVSYFLAARPELRVSQVYATATKVCSIVSLSLMLVCYAGLHLLMLFFRPEPHLVTWVASLALVAWSFDVARRQRSIFFSIVALAGLFALAASALQAYAQEHAEWIPALWVALSAVMIPVLRLAGRHRDSAWRPLVDVASMFIPTVLLLTSFGSLVFFTAPALVAGIGAPLVAMAWFAGRGSLETLHPLRLQLPLMILNWRLFGAVIACVLPEAEYLFQAKLLGSLVLCLPVALAAAASALVWIMIAARKNRRVFMVGDVDLALFQVDAMRYLTFVLLGLSLFLTHLSPTSIALAFGTFALLTISELFIACKRGDEINVWKSEGLVALAVGYFAWFSVITFGRGWAMYIVLGVGYALRFFADVARSRPQLAVFAGPFRATGLVLPGIAVLLAVVRHLFYVERIVGGTPVDIQWLGWNSLALLAAAMFYFHEGMVPRERKRGLGTVLVRERRYTVAAAVILNTAMMLLCRELKLADPQFYMIPIGVTILCLIELLEREIPERFRDPLRYAGALVILVSPTFHIVTGSWLHIFTLMVASVFVILAAIGFRIRAIMYTGTAFLAADIVAMIARGSVDHPQLLWVAGAAFGAGILGLGAVCELKRERVQQRVRAVGSALAEWK